MNKKVSLKTFKKLNIFWWTTFRIETKIFIITLIMPADLKSKSLNLQGISLNNKNLWIKIEFDFQNMSFIFDKSKP